MKFNEGVCSNTIIIKVGSHLSSSALFPMTYPLLGFLISEEDCTHIFSLKCKYKSEYNALVGATVSFYFDDFIDFNYYSDWIGISFLYAKHIAIDTIRYRQK